MVDIVEVITDPPSVLEIVADPPSIVNVITSGPQGPPGPTGPPGAGAVTVQHIQDVPATVWGPIAHGLGSKPAAVSIFDVAFAIQYAEFVVQHLDENTLRIAMDVPTTGVALISS